MIIKSIKTADFEIVIQQGDNNYYSVTLLKNGCQAEYQGLILNLEDAMTIYDYYMDRMTETDLTGWQGAIE